MVKEVLRRTKKLVAASRYLQNVKDIQLEVTAYDLVSPLGWSGCHHKRVDKAD